MFNLYFHLFFLSVNKLNQSLFIMIKAAVLMSTFTNAVADEYKDLNVYIFIHCEKVSFRSEFGEQQAIDEDTATRSMRFMSIVKIYINLNK